MKISGTPSIIVDKDLNKDHFMTDNTQILSKMEKPDLFHVHAEIIRNPIILDKDE